MNIKKYISEFLGTMFITLIGCGVAVAYGFSTGWLAIALAFGLTVMAMYYIYAPISGAHLNPAVSLGMWVTKKIDFKDFIIYIIAQFLGGIVAAAVLLIFFDAGSGLGANAYNDLSNWDLNWWQALIAEILLTVVFVMVFITVVKKKNKDIRGVVIGLTYTAVYLLGIPLTGASINPARSLGPAIFTGGLAIRHMWLFIVAPMIGGLLAAIGCKAYEKKAEKIENELM